MPDPPQNLFRLQNVGWAEPLSCIFPPEAIERAVRRHLLAVEMIIERLASTDSLAGWVRCIEPLTGWEWLEHESGERIELPSLLACQDGVRR